MIHLHAFCPSFKRPRLHMWRPSTRIRLHLTPDGRTGGDEGWLRFSCELDHQIREPLRFLLYDETGAFEDEVHIRELPRLEGERFPSEVFFFEGCSRLVLEDPRKEEREGLRIHLRSDLRYRQGFLYRWNRPDAPPEMRVADGEDEGGPYWDLTLQGRERRFFHYKFVRDDGIDFEPDHANRVWVARDGDRIWTVSHCQTAIAEPPRPTRLRIHFKQEGLEGPAPTLHVRQLDSDFRVEVPGRDEAEGWTLHEAELFASFPYRLLFFDPTLDEERRWEHEEAARTVSFDEPVEWWTLEGDRHLFEREPTRDRSVRLSVAQGSPGTALCAPFHAQVWVNRARGFLDERVEADGAGLHFLTYPEIDTSFRLGCGAGVEEIERHVVRVPSSMDEVLRYVVPERLHPPEGEAPETVFEDPPFLIRRPGAYEEDGEIRFVLHAPSASRVEVIGDFTAWRSSPLAARCTLDGSYWWAQISIEELGTRLGNPDYHGMHYKFLLDGTREVQDPAAGWVENSAPESASRLVRSSAFDWHDEDWELPTPDYFILYQVHPYRFTNRFQDLPPLVRVAREIEEDGGYLRGLGVTALQLMPVSEFPGDHSWGYDPAFFYAIEESYGGPDGLKYLVDVCHRNGLAVFLDVVFNHVGPRDNALWAVAAESYFDGDTQWGALVNFDHPQCRHFFEQNLVYLQREFHVDGFRLDHTHTMVHSSFGDSNAFVREPGSGGGWDFLHGLRRALREEANPRCFLVAEHLPNEWALTNRGGPLDAQWCDDFHDRLLDACRGHFVMSELARALEISGRDCDGWFEVVNYPESHDEVGNTPDRIANVAGYGRGLRMSKVAAAATLLARGLPMFFMGAEGAEHRQFKFDSFDLLDLEAYRGDPAKARVRAWWSTLCWLRRHEPALRGASPLRVAHADPAGQLLVFTRGDGDEWVVILNFGGQAGQARLAELGLGGGTYHERCNSTWPVFAVEGEDEHANGGPDGSLAADEAELSLPDYGVVVLERL